MVTKIGGEDKIEHVVVTKDGEDTIIETDCFVPLFGLSPKLGPI